MWNLLGLAPVEAREDFSMRTRLLPSLLVAVIPTGGTPGLASVASAFSGERPARAEDKDLSKFQGKWKLVAYERTGSKATAEDVEGMNASVAFSGDAFSVTAYGTTARSGEFHIDSSQSPKWYESSHEDGTHVVGIYRIADDTLTLCMVTLGNPRPSSFSPGEADSGYETYVATYKRVK